jgi:hypothetical protein
MANSCNYNCTDLPEHEQISCGNWLKGGMGALAIIACDHTITDWSSTEEWETNIAAGKIRRIMPVRASIPEPSPVEGENPNGCGALNIIDTYDRTILWKDFNVTASNVDLYNEMNKQNSFVAGFQGCDNADRIWVIDSPVTWNARHSIDENNRIKQMFSVTGSWTSFDMPTFYDAPTGIFTTA